MKTREQHNEYARNWYKNLSPEKRKKIAEHESKYQTKHYVSTYRNGKSVLLVGTKRDKPTDLKCELCQRQCTNQHIAYHHYDDIDLMKGLWLCIFCHAFAERYDSGFSDAYLKLKLMIGIV